MRTTNRNKRIQSNVRLPVQLKDQIAKETERMGISMNDYILLALYEKVNHQKQLAH